MRLFNPAFSNPAIPAFHSNRVIVAFGRALLQHIFEYQQLQGHNIILQYDRIPLEVYLDFGRAFLDAYRAGEDGKRLLGDRRAELMQSFLGVQAFVVHSETGQPYFLDPADTPPFSTVTAPENLATVVGVGVAAAASAAEAAAQSSSTPARAAAVFEDTRDKGLAESGLKPVVSLGDLFSIVFEMLASLVIPGKDGDFSKKLTAMLMFGTRFVRIFSVVLSLLLESYDPSEMKDRWIVIERKHRDDDFDGIGELTRSYLENREGLVKRIAQCDTKHRYIERVEAITDSSSGWGYTNDEKRGQSIWKKFESQADADAVVAHVGAQAKASSHKVRGSSEFLVVIKLDSISLDEADRAAQEESGAAAGPPS